MTPDPTLHFYTRAGCHLCEETRLTLQEVLEERAAAGRRTPAVRVIDIDRDPVALDRYRDTIPVLALEGRELPLAGGGQRIRAFLDEALPALLA